MGCFLNAQGTLNVISRRRSRKQNPSTCSRTSRGNAPKKQQQQQQQSHSHANSAIYAGLLPMPALYSIGYVSNIRQPFLFCHLLKKVVILFEFGPEKFFNRGKLTLMNDISVSSIAATITVKITTFNFKPHHTSKHSCYGLSLFVTVMLIC